MAQLQSFRKQAKDDLTSLKLPKEEKVSILETRRNPKIFGAIWKNLVFPEWHENFEAFGISRYGEYWRYNPLTNHLLTSWDIQVFRISSARPFHDTESVHGESVDWPFSGCWIKLFFHGPKWAEEVEGNWQKWREWVVGGWSGVSYRPFCKRNSSFWLRRRFRWRFPFLPCWDLGYSSQKTFCCARKMVVNFPFSWSFREKNVNDQLNGVNQLPPTYYPPWN